MRFYVFLLLLASLLWGSVGDVHAQRRLSYRKWQLVFSDDFDTYRNVADMAARGPWEFTPGEYRTLINNQYEDSYYDSAALQLANGSLHMVAQPLPEPIVYKYHYQGRDSSKVLHYLGGWLTLKEDFATNALLGDTSRWTGNKGFQYGLFEIRCKLSPGTGLGPAFWLYSGPTEIDVLEAEHPRKASNNVHYVPKDPTQNKALQQIYDYKEPVDLAQDFHTYSAVWTATEVSFYLDRQLLRTVTTDQVPTVAAPAILIANMGVSSYADTNTWPGELGQKKAPFVIDYIKVYKSREALGNRLREVKAAVKAAEKSKK